MYKEGSTDSFHDSSVFEKVGISRLPFFDGLAWARWCFQPREEEFRKDGTSRREEGRSEGEESNGKG